MTTLESEEYLRMAAWEAVQETLADPSINPDEEEERLANNVRSMYRTCLQEQLAEDEYRREQEEA